MTALPPIDGFAAMPGDDDGPVFREPWEARAFAVVMKLHEAGHFTWPEWVAALATEIKAAQMHGDADQGDTYYRHWLVAAEKLIAAKQLVTPSELEAKVMQVAAEIPHHAHHAVRTPLTIA